MSDNRPERKCVVCGDKSAGFNFNVLTCVSCKAFFRRNALKNKELKCLFTGKCEINSITRKFCPKCRLTKCFDVGMKKELILSEEEKRNRKNKLSQKKNKPKESNDISDDTMTDISSKSSEIDDQFIADILNDDSISEEEVQKQISELEGALSGRHSSSVHFDDISSDVLEKAAEFEFAIVPISRPLTDYRNNFTEMEGNRLSELLAALKLMDCPFGECVYKPDNCLDSLCCLSDNMEMIIERLVQASKRLTLFNEICEEDQLALIKYGAIEVSCMRQVIGYDQGKNQLRVPGDQPNSTIVVDLDLLKDSLSFTHIIYSPTVRYYERISGEWDCDNVILNLLTAIVLFNPDRPKLTHRDMIKYQQFIYMYLLKRYLQLRYQSECVAKTKFLRLLNTFKPLNDLYAKHLELYSEAKKINTESCEDSILNEVYNPD